jgi:hypothetical protein
VRKNVLSISTNRVLPLKEAGHMITSEQQDALKELVRRASQIIITFVPNRKIDQVAAALALSTGLQQLGKKVSLVTPKPLDKMYESLPHIDQVSQQLGNKNLQISFDYQEDIVDKISYHIDEENNRFNLVIQPKKGALPLDPQTIQYSFSGADADLIFTIGVSDLNDLDQLYMGYEQLYDQASVISINSYEPNFGTIKIDSSGASSLSETIASMLKSLGVQWESELSTDLLAGLEDATESFRSLSTTAETFELVAELMKAGGRRLPRPSRMTPAAGNGFAAALSKVQKIQDLTPLGQVDEADGVAPSKKKKKIEPPAYLSEGKPMMT